MALICYTACTMSFNRMKIGNYKILKQCLERQTTSDFVVYAARLYIKSDVSGNNWIKFNGNSCRVKCTFTIPNSFWHMHCFTHNFSYPDRISTRYYSF